MMFERFTDGARDVLVQAQHGARRLGHDYIGCEHLLLAAAAATEPAAEVLRDHGVTPERIEAVITRIIGRGPAVDPVGGLDREALAAIGIDLDVVRARLEAAFGPDALARAVLAHKPAPARGRRRPAWAKGPVAELIRRRKRRRRAGPAALTGPPPVRPAGAPRHIPFTPRAKKTLELSLREAVALHDDYIGTQHLILALLAIRDGMPREILSALGAPGDSLRAAVLARYRKAS
jgi:ATP-dependent Clp protease ATP-binding subunit ClpA